MEVMSQSLHALLIEIRDVVKLRYQLSSRIKVRACAERIWKTLGKKDPTVPRKANDS